MRKSIVSVEFDNREYPLTYLNDSFDLQVGDTVYVEGALEGKRGTVLYINYSYKVKVGEYKKIIGVADTKVTGQFYYLNSHFVTFDPKALPKNKVITWFKAPDIEPVEYEYGYDEEEVLLVDFGKKNVRDVILERGGEYYKNNKVKYISVKGTKGYAIVEGNEAYEVEFCYKDGKISRLVCNCPCAFTCKHEVAAMYQLRECLDGIKEMYEKEYAETDYFAAVYAPMFAYMAMRADRKGGFRLE